MQGLLEAERTPTRSSGRSREDTRPRQGLGRRAQPEGIDQQMADLRPGAQCYQRQRAALRPVQRKGAGPVGSDIHRVAQAGVAGAGSRLPHLVSIQRSFGGHDVTGVRSHSGARAAEAASALGAEAYATGEDVAFGGPAKLHTAAHEAAHVVQQRAGVQLAGGVGRAGDRHEQHADAVADAVVQGRSAVPLLDQLGQAGPSSAAPTGSAIQCDLAEEAKSRIRNKLTELIRRTGDFEHELARWLSRNWTSFMSATGGNCFLAWSDGQHKTVVKTALGTSLSLAPRALPVITRGTSTLQVGSFVGPVMGALTSLIVGAIMNGMANRAKLVAVDSALRDLGQKVIVKDTEFDQQYRQELERIRGYGDRLRDTIDAADNSATLHDIEQWIEAESAVIPTNSLKNDYTYRDRLLDDWVLQHAGDEEDPNKETNEVAWDDAREKRHNLKPNDNFRPVRDLFIHQARYEWGRMGLDLGPTRDFASKLGKLYSQEPASVVKAFHGSKQLWREARDLGLLTSHVHGKFRERWRRCGASPCLGDTLAAGRFWLYCTLNLTDADGSVYVDRYDYALILDPDDSEGPTPSHERFAEWTESPK